MLFAFNICIIIVSLKASGATRLIPQDAGRLYSTQDLEQLYANVSLGIALDIDEQRIKA